MNDNYINFYNNLVQLTRNKKLYEDFTKQDTFFDRLTIFLFICGILFGVLIVRKVLWNIFQFFPHSSIKIL